MSRRVLVSGGSKGIGLAIARGLQDVGDDVAILSRTPGQSAGLAHLACDLRSPAAVEAAIGDWLAAGDNQIDVFVHAAVLYGAPSRRPFVETDLPEWDNAMNVNARGLFLGLHAVLPAMLAQDAGTVLHISSDIATQPGPGRIPYAASKAAARAVLMGLTEELQDSGVSIVEWLPTTQVDTPGIRSRRGSDFTADGYAQPEAFVAATLWLLQHAREHHGHCLHIDASGQLMTAEGKELP